MPWQPTQPSSPGRSKIAAPRLASAASTDHGHFGGPIHLVRSSATTAAFVMRGTVTVLADSGLDDAEAIRWLFTPDPTLPEGATPIDALQAGQKTEIRRRAAELAF